MELGSQVRTDGPQIGVASPNLPSWFPFAHHGQVSFNVLSVAHIFVCNSSSSAVPLSFASDIIAAYIQELKPWSLKSTSFCLYNKKPLKNG